MHERIFIKLGPFTEEAVLLQTTSFREISFWYYLTIFLNIIKKQKAKWWFYMLKMEKLDHRMSYCIRFRNINIITITNNTMILWESFLDGIAKWRKVPYLIHSFISETFVFSSCVCWNRCISGWWGYFETPGKMDCGLLGLFPPLTETH